MNKTNRFWWFILATYLISFIVIIDWQLTDKKVFGQYIINLGEGGYKGTPWARNAFVTQYMLVYTLLSLTLFLDKWLISPEYYARLMERRNFKPSNANIFGVPIINVPYMILVLFGSKNIAVYEMYAFAMFLGLYLFGIYKMIYPFK